MLTDAPPKEQVSGGGAGAGCRLSAAAGGDLRASLLLRSRLYLNYTLKSTLRAFFGVFLYVCAFFVAFVVPKRMRAAVAK